MHRKSFILVSQQLGKYTVSPLTRRDAGGLYSASLSIRSGRGSMTHDRVMRFVPQFDSLEEAAGFARDQAFAWLERAAAGASQPSHSKE